ncbi:MAG: gluconeogenesis factor YvcK family protein [Acetomicrobium sp.]|nr:YvcK family protein [Acetomicrobium sp.]
MSSLVSFFAGIFLGGAVAYLFSRRTSNIQRDSKTGDKIKERYKDVYFSASRQRLSLGPYIVALGGGTGLSTLLKGLKCFTRNITAVVTVTDEGGSSGRLRQEWGMLPPGDIRNCLLALAEDDSSLNRLLNFRFDRGELAGHSLGNLLLLAATEIAGDFRKGIEELNYMLAIRGQVLPVTTESICLVGRTKNGVRVEGELNITNYGSSLEEIWLEPKGVKPLPEVLNAISNADLIVLGPGSLFTSVIPNLLVEKVANAIVTSPAPVVYVCNLMTQPLETEGFTVLDHVRWIAKVLRGFPDFVVVNAMSLPEEISSKYTAAGSMPLLVTTEEKERFKKIGIDLIEDKLYEISEEGAVRHNSVKLAECLIRIARSAREREIWKESIQFSGMSG